MAVKLTKNELKVQKDRLKQFQRYLPTLQLKKQQLQSVVMQVTAQLEQVEQQRRAAGQAPGDPDPPPPCGVRPGEHRRCHRSGVPGAEL